MAYPKAVEIVEVGPRDGLQNEKTPVSVETRLAFIGMLADAGLRVIEAGAFVSPKWVPQMADSAAVYARLDHTRGIRYPMLVPNERGMQAAIAAGVREVAIFTAASETFTRKNINCSIDESFARFGAVMEMARAHDIRVRGYVSCVLGCPYEGAIDPARAADVAARLLDLGCFEVSLGDTIGTGTPESTGALLAALSTRTPVDKLAAHFHDTYGRAVDNLRIALAAGIAVVDSAAGGLGGCPYAPGAAGNVSTEKVLALLEELLIPSHIEAAKVATAGRFIARSVGKQLI
jgi:hydroxymethylglutaryl-CoA lyase